MSKRLATRHHRAPARQYVGTVEPMVKSRAEQTFASHDGGLLERARTQWQFGDWQSLVQINRDTLEHHPDRAKLALLAAAGRLQTGGNDSEARQFIRLAQSWGASRKLIHQILIAGVHNSLGRAAAISNQQQRVFQHFENAITVGTPGSDARLLIKARVAVQLKQIKLFDFDIERLISGICSQSINNISDKNKVVINNTRWLAVNNLSKSWDSRTKLIADLIEPDKSVIEFGAGRMILRDMLPPSCIYTPSDLYNRGEGTLVIDLNGKDYPELGIFDIAVFSGVLEYIIDLKRLIKYISNSSRKIIASYAVYELNEHNRNNWVNSYTSEQFLDIFSMAGYLCIGEHKWKRQIIYEFINSNFR